jgi:hypothetical protein
MHDKSLPLAVRVDRNPPSLQKMEIKTTLGDPVEYQLVNIPNYLAWRIPQLINCLQ